MEVAEIGTHGAVESVESFTEAQLEVLEMRANGFSNKEIADELGISDSAVEKRLRKVCVHLNAGNVTHAVAKAITRNIIKLRVSDD